MTTAQPSRPKPTVGNLSRDELERALLGTRQENAVSSKVIAVLVERLTKLTGAIAVSISDEALMDCPDLDARRDAARRVVVMRVSR